MKDESLALDFEDPRLLILFDADDSREVGEDETSFSLFPWEMEGFRGEGEGGGGEEDG